MLDDLCLDIVFTDNLLETIFSSDFCAAGPFGASIVEFDEQFLDIRVFIRDYEFLFTRNFRRAFSEYSILA